MHGLPVGMRTNHRITIFLEQRVPARALTINNYD